MITMIMYDQCIKVQHLSSMLAKHTRAVAQRGVAEAVQLRRRRYAVMKDPACARRR